LYVVFFFSGFPALIYQIVWQRALFAVYGVNIESVTVVVTAFMLGLGLGSLFGGQLSKRTQWPLLLIFGFVELGIAAYGLLSLRIFHWVAGFTAGSSLFKTSIVTLLLVLVPTMLMGCTLPLLVAHIVRVSKSVGQSVGRLYFVNTLGSAVACFIAANITMKHLGQSGSVLLAAIVNVVIGTAVLSLYLYSRRQGENALAVQQDQETDSALVPAHYIRFSFAMAIAALAGFIALAYEIIWYRVFSFTTEGLARSFAVVLGSYLAGIAYGSWAAEKFCKKYANEESRAWIMIIALLVIVANLTGFLVIPFLVYTSGWLNYQAALPLVALAAGLLGAVFPLVSHAAIAPGSDSGARLSYLYLSNIVGSAAGSFVVGFVLMDLWPLSRIAVVLVLAGVTLGALLLARPLSRKNLVAALGGCTAILVLIVFLTAPLFSHAYERLCFKQTWFDNPRFARFVNIVETKSGVISASPRGMVYGDGSWEARLNTSLDDDFNFNFTLPPFALSSFHPHPRRVLMIGLGGGAWAEIIANHPQLEKLTIVEINPGYLQLIARYPQVSGVLKNPKVQFVIDDGRRWLLENPDAKFDILVMNTRMHWRDHASSLLSAEFLKLARQHLNTGSILFYNTTYSPRALLTGATVFPYALRIMGFVAVSDSPLEIDLERWRNVMLQYRLDGNRVLNLDTPTSQRTLQKMMFTMQDFHPSGEWGGIDFADGIRRRYAGLRLITDDNMGDEWR
jgi:predicted membrane-bound spermidine synthase